MSKDNILCNITPHPTKDIKIIGCGGAGIKTLEFLKAQGISNAVFYAVDYDDALLHTIGADVKICLNPNASAEELHKRLDLSDDDSVIIIAGLGKNAGSKLVSVLAETVKNIACCYVMLPYLFEGFQRTNKAKEICEILSSLGVKTEVIDNNKFLEAAPKNMNIEQMHEEIYNMIYNSIIKLKENMQ